MDRFADRFDARGYADDEPIGIGLSSEAVDDRLFVPTPIFDRLLAVGSAYRLHVLGARLQRGQLILLNAVQCEGLLDELAWIGEVLADPLVAELIPRIEHLAAACARSPDEHLLVDLEG